MTTNPAEVAERYLALWNEQDGEVRRALFGKTWTEDAAYIDPMGSGQGAAGIDQLIAGVQERFPSFSFRLKGEADGYGDHVRFSWAYGPGGDIVDAPIEGTDFVELEAGRIKRVSGFLDRIPPLS